MLRVFFSLLCLASAIHAHSLCDLKADDGLQCECTDTEAICEPTRPLVSLVPAAHRASNETSKQRRDTRNINTLLLQSKRNASFLQNFPKDIFDEPLHFKNVRIAYAQLSVLASFAVRGSQFLKELTMSSCGIVALERKAIVGLTNLLKLDLSNNLMKEFKTGALSNLPNLEELYITGSVLSDVEPHAFVELRSLKKLSLKDNQITYVDNQLCTGLNQLESIDLSFNYISEIDDRTFQDLPKLTHLDLTGNQIHSITPQTFKGMRALEYLSLNYNDLLNLPDAFLHDSKNMKHLNLRRNQLSVVTLGMLDGLKVIRPNFILDLAFNPLNCSCDLYYLTELRKRRLAVMDNEIDDPPEFKSLHCRILDHGAFEPRTLDDEVFVKEECQRNPGLTHHIGSMRLVSSASRLKPLLAATVASLLVLRLV